MVSDERLKDLILESELAGLCFEHQDDEDVLSALRELLSRREQDGRNVWKLAMWLVGAKDMCYSEAMIQQAEKILAENPTKTVSELCMGMLLGTEPAPPPEERC